MGAGEGFFSLEVPEAATSAKEGEDESESEEEGRTGPGVEGRAWRRTFAMICNERSSFTRRKAKEHDDK